MRDQDATDLLRKLQETARAGSKLYEPARPVRNANLSDIVHAGYRFGQSAVAFGILVFHFGDHVFNKQKNKMDPKIKRIPEMWNPIFYTCYPICLVASFVLGILRAKRAITNPKPMTSLTISLLGVFLMMFGGIAAMRHAEVYIDQDVITDKELRGDPIFIHNVAMCSMSILGAAIYLIHVWICYDVWRWERKERKLEVAVNAIQASSSSIESANGVVLEDGGVATVQPSPAATEATPKKRHLPESDGKSARRVTFGELMNKDLPNQLDVIFSMEDVRKRTEEISRRVDVQDEPVILYCCCVDLLNYIRHEYIVKRPVHEFQVVHIM